MSEPIIIKIGNTDVFLQDMGTRQGKVTISDTEGHNYSYYWGAMGTDLKSFIKSIDNDYFAKNLIGQRNCWAFCSKSTFRALRKFIKEELGFPYYRYMDFQKDMRLKIKSFQYRCENGDHFIYEFPTFISSLDFSLINDRYDSKESQKEFESISEPWSFIQQCRSKEYEWITELHKKLKSSL